MYVSCVPWREIGDVCLATNYTELVDAGPGSYGTPNVGWFDTEGEPYVNSICAMVWCGRGGGMEWFTRWAVKTIG